MSSSLDRRRALADGLAAREVRRKPASPRQFSPPVAWLMGPEMLGAVKQLVLHALYKGEFDPHDWMTGNVVTYDAPADGEFWFDYIADLGDGQAATYTNALVLQDDLFVDGALDEVARKRGADAQLPAMLGARPAGWSTLPRGRLLVVGGDTAYPVADAINLDGHVRQPFTWAYRDLVAAGRLVDDEGRGAPPVDLYGIPGNHDYYDLLSGFRRVFRATPTDSSDGARSMRRRIDLLGFACHQQATYAALELPWDWRVWLLDPGERDLDYRQECFFREHGVADKMFVALPTPPVVFGRVVAERSWLHTMQALGLAMPFLADSTVLRDGRPPEPDLRRELEPHQCRVDIAGDIHCYQRYGGAADPDDPRYAAIVSGAGGAFSHPTTTTFGEAPVRASFPAPDEARRVFARRLFAPFTILGNGVLGVLTFALAALICLGSFRADTRVATDALLRALGVVGERGIGGGPSSRAAAGWGHLTGACAMVGASIAGIVMIVLAIRYVRWITHALRAPPDARPAFVRALHRIPGGTVLAERGFLPAWLLFAGAILLPTIVSQFAWMPPASTLMFQLLFLGVLLVFAGGLLLLARTGGAEYQRRGERWPFWLLGAGHAAIQLLLPLVLVRVGFARPVALVPAAAILAGGGALGYALARRPGRVARWLGVAVWAGHAVAIVAVLVTMTGGVALGPSTTLEAVGFVLAAGVAGALVGCYELGWYLGVAFACNGHNNEAGVASRVDRFNQFIRFRVEPTRITGYVIATDLPVTSLAEVRARVVDVFTVEPGRR